MLRHVAVFRWSDEATEEQKRAVVEALATLPGLIGTIRSYRFGPDAALVDGNFDFAVTADFDDVEGFRHYLTHPSHQAVLTERVRPILAERAATQFLLDG